MKKVMSAIILLVLGLEAFAQSVVPANIRATNTLEKLFDSNGLYNGEILYGIPLPEGKTVGDTYLDTHWRNSNILLYETEKLIEGYPVRYDIYRDELEIKGKNGIKVLAGSKVRSFVWVDSASRTAAYFLNGKAFRNEDDVPLTGFVQVLTEGSLPLIKKTYLDIKKADYNIALNVGSPDDKILKKSKFYVLNQDRLVEIPSSRKKFLDLFNEDANLEEFIKNNNLTTSREEHLKRIFEHYNSVQNN